MVKDSFRSPGWGDADRQDFEQHLTRARKDGRAQYTRMKGLALAAGGHESGAMELFVRVLNDPLARALEIAATHEHIGNLHRAGGRLDAAGAEYRAALGASPTLSGTSGEVHLALGEVLLESHGQSAVGEVESLIVKYQSRLTLNSSIFRQRVLRSRIAMVRGDRELSRQEALSALALIGVGSQFARHPGVGVASPSPDLLAELMRMAAN